MIDKGTQDIGDQVQGALELNLLYWKEFFTLDISQRADAEKRLQQKEKIFADSTRHYEVIVGRAGLHEVPLVPRIGNNPAYFKKKQDAQTLVDYLVLEKKVTARIKEHD